MTDSCQVKGCNNESVATFECMIEIETTKKMEKHTVNVCSEHEKAFSTLANQERFYN